MRRDAANGRIPGATRKVASVKVVDLSGVDRTPLVAQAVARISMQLDCAVDEALTLLHALMRTRRENLQETAASVVNGIVLFDD